MNRSQRITSLGIVLLCLACSANTAQAFNLDSLKNLNPLKQKEEKAKAKVDKIDDYEWCGTSEEEIDVDAAREGSNEPDKAEAEARENALLEKNKRVVKCMISSLLRVEEAQSDFAEALGAKDQADKLRAESEALKSANYYTDDKALKKHVSVSRETNKIIRSKLAKNQQLSEEGRKQFIDGMLDYAVAIRETKEMTDAIGPYYDAAKVEAQRVHSIYNGSKGNKNILSAIADGLNYLKAILGKQFNTTKYLVKKGRSLVDDHKSTISSVMVYAKDNSIKIPPEVETTMIDFV